MNRNLATSVLVLVSLLMISCISMPAIYATGTGQKWDAHPYFQLGGNATSSPTGLNTTQVWSAYGFSKLSCSMTSSQGWDYVNLCGHGQVIAVVDAYDDPTIENDLATFDNQWGLPDCTNANGCFEKITPDGSPSTNPTWALEESLDVEWAHATAPGAKIVLVESQSNSFQSLIDAINYTQTKTDAAQVSMGWGIPEFQNETIYDSYFDKPGVSFFTSSGNGDGHIYPSVSPYVISVGGTTLDIAAGGAVKSETAWSGSTGGQSYYEQEPQYQTMYDVNSDVKRSVPDVSYDANPNTGFSVYDSTAYGNKTGWFLVGGTSAGATQWAGIAAIANGQGAGLSSYRFTTISNLYTAATGTLYSSNFRDITQGGTVDTTATPGYDFASGLGTPISNGLISFLSPKPTVSSVPLHVTAVASDGQISLTWQAPSFTGGSQITGYHIYRGASSAGEMMFHAMSSTNQSFVDTRLGNGIPYYYYVTAVNSVGQSRGSNEVYATPGTISSTPQDLVADLTNGNVYLTWHPPASTNGSPVTKYNIYRGTYPGLEVLLKSTSSDTASYTDNTVQSDQTYYYYVTAVNTGGESAPSSDASVSASATVPSSPPSLESVATKNQISLTWQMPSSTGGSPIIKYNIYAGTAPGTETLLSSVSANVLYYTNYYVVNGVPYYYYVTAVNSLGESQKSNEVSSIPG
ncbi:MAG: fibronectin type III domain-containing protein [Nitrosotalea sp.]